jgi:hypothetical protein
MQVKANTGLWAATLLLLSGCGGGGDAPKDKSDAASAAGGATPAASTASGCPKAPAGAPTIQGVAIGMTGAEAIAALKCTDAGYRADYAPRSGTGVPWLPDGTYMRLSIVGGRSDDKSQDKVSVEIYGLKGEERVIGVSRNLFFYPGGQPLIEKTKEQLAQKYSALEPIAPANMGSALAEEIGIARDSAGAPLPRTSDGMMQNHCWGGEGYAARDTRCGASILARIGIDSSNPQLVSNMRISLDNGSYAAKVMQETDAKIAATQQQAKNADTAAAADRTPSF